MNRFLALLRVNFLALISGIKMRGKKKAVGTVGSIALIVFIGVYISATYSWLFASALAPVGALSLLGPLMAVLTAFMSLTLTVFGASGFIFGGKDSDFVLALPVSAFEVMLSKILALYLENLLISFAFMLPCGVVYMMYAESGGLIYLLMTVPSTVFLAFIPTLLGVLIGYVIAFYSARAQKKKTLLSTLLYLAFFVGIMGLSFSLNGLLAKLGTNAEKIYAAFYRALLPFGLYGRACGGEIGALLLLAAICVFPFLAVVWLMSRRYKAILSGLSAHAVRRDYRLVQGHSGSAFAALYKKELARFFGSSVYFINCSFGAILLVMATVVALVKRDMLLEMTEQFSAMGMPLLPMLVMGGAFMIGTVDTTSVSISLEGQNLWILKAAPIRARTIFLAKIALNLTVTVPAALLCVPTIGALIGMSLGSILLAAAVCLLFTVFLSVFGVIVNLKFPRVDADNDTVVVKQSLSAMIGMLGGMVVVGLSALLWSLVSDFFTFEVYLAVVCGLLVLGSAVCLAWLSRKGEQEFLSL